MSCCVVFCYNVNIFCCFFCLRFGLNETALLLEVVLLLVSWYTISYLLQVVIVCCRFVFEMNIIDSCCYKCLCLSIVSYSIDLLMFSENKVNKNTLTHEVAHGFSGDVLRWIENWLSGRKQRVVLGGQVSELSDILSAVPPGFVLGPILFVLYISDIDILLTAK